MKSKKVWRTTHYGSTAGFIRPWPRIKRPPPARKPIIARPELLHIELVAENNWMRRALYAIGAPRWMTRAV